MAVKEMEWAPEEKPRLRHLNSLGSGCEMWHLDLTPVLGMACPDPDVFLLPCCLHDAFNPASADMVREIREGHLLRVTADPEHPLFKFWDPPERFRLPKGYDRTFIMKFEAPDSFDEPIKIFEPAP